MINLPKPSSLSMKGRADEKIEYLLSYLKKLVSSLEKQLSGLSANKCSGADTVLINAFSYNDKGFIISKTDGSKQIIESNKKLWSGASQMAENTTISLSSKISAQPSGIVLVFSAYSNSQAQDYHFQSFFIPKSLVKNLNGGGAEFPLISRDFSYIGSKYLLIYNGSITGYSGNDQSGTNSGIAYNNAHWVLRYVIGV